ncbi:hypothetical protein DPMN_010751 [Dreissena polymorpha]|uniref:Uncharacterized protein n=1 Tax=Dreissena polymorpha TaxID=45954 RepID=A0A9D4S1A8_DREPO|nr:hypothetical protein DPMN_010751 [Dreissena polymorpha]
MFFTSILVICTYCAFSFNVRGAIISACFDWEVMVGRSDFEKAATLTLKQKCKGTFEVLLHKVPLPPLGLFERFEEFWNKHVSQIVFAWIFVDFDAHGRWKADSPEADDLWLIGACVRLLTGAGDSD